MGNTSNSEKTTINNKKRWKWSLIAITIVLPAAFAHGAPIYRPEQSRREINTDEYQLIIQKNSQIDLRTTAGVPIIDNAVPTITFEDGRQRALQIDHRQSSRFSVRNALGRGNGFQFIGPEAEWGIATYPTQPFLTMDLTFINATRKPVRVARLSPFGIGKGGGVYVGWEASQVRILQGATESDPYARIVGGTESSPGHLAAYNPVTGNVLVAGFVTHRLGSGVVALNRTSGASGSAFDHFAPECVFDPPVTVLPGGRLQSETLYIAIVEHNPQEALERFVQAAQRLEPDSAEERGPDVRQAAPGAGEGPIVENLGAATLQDWALASRQYYVPRSSSPLLNALAGRVPQAADQFDDNEFITAYTLAGLAGALDLSDAPNAGLSALRAEVLARLLPAPTNGARPLDLFQDGPPQRWRLPLSTPAGNWTIVGLFNWDPSAPVQLDTPLTDLGLNNDNDYTVYDFWAGRFLGLIEKQLRVEVPPEGVRLLGLRRYEKRPMLIAVDRHFTQGALSHTRLDWSYEDNCLSGAFKATADSTYTFTLLIPEPYTLSTVEATQPVQEQRLDGTVLKFIIPVTDAGEVTWRASF